MSTKIELNYDALMSLLIHSIASITYECKPDGIHCTIKRISGKADIVGIGSAQKDVLSDPSCSGALESAVYNMLATLLDEDTALYIKERNESQQLLAQMENEVVKQAFLRVADASEGEANV